MSPHIIATVTIDDEDHRNENYSPSSQDSSSPKPKRRVLYCRKCEGHGEKVILKNHSPKCPYIMCNCKSCVKLNCKKLQLFDRRNKEKIELYAKRHVSESSSSVNNEEEYAMRICVNETEDEKPFASIAPAPLSIPMSQQQLPMNTIAQLPMTIMAPISTMVTPNSMLDIPPTSSKLCPFQIPVTSSPMLPCPAPTMAPSQLLPFEPVGLPTTQQASLVNILSTEQSISSLILHNTVLQQKQQQQNNQMYEDLLDGGSQSSTQPPVDAFAMLRIQQQAASLSAFVQAAGFQLPLTFAVPTPVPAQAQQLQMFQMTLPNLSTSSLLNPFLQSPLYTNPV